jgi:hypothetical protein
MTILLSSPAASPLVPLKKNSRLGLVGPQSEQ